MGELGGFEADVLNVCRKQVIRALLRRGQSRRVCVEVLPSALEVLRGVAEEGISGVGAACSLKSARSVAGLNACRVLGKEVVGAVGKRGVV